jgi:hypothetical protein
MQSSASIPEGDASRVVIGAFNRVIEIGDDGNVVPPANQIVGCLESASVSTFDAVPIDGGQLIAGLSVAAWESCPPADQGVSGVPSIHIARRTTTGAIQELHVLTARATAVHLVASVDGPWLVITDATNRPSGGAIETSFVRLDPSGHPLTQIIPLKTAGGTFVGAASVGDRLLLAVDFGDRAALQLIDETGALIDEVATARIFAMARAPEANRVVMTQMSTLPLGPEAPMELVRYDCGAP